MRDLKKRLIDNQKSEAIDFFTGANPCDGSRTVFLQKRQTNSHDAIFHSSSSVIVPRYTNITLRTNNLFLTKVWRSMFIVYHSIFTAYKAHHGAYTASQPVSSVQR